MNKIMKRLGQTTAGVLLGGSLFDAFYKRKLNLITINPGEKPLLPTKDPLVDDIKWVDEETYYYTMNMDVMPYIKERQEDGKLDCGEYQLAYSYYTVDEPIATLVIVHGFNEFKEKYYELIYYFLQQNIEVFVYDQRGHGFSKQDASDSQVDIQEFYEYVEDLNSFIDLIVAPKQKSNTRIILAHSMGGAVSTNFAQDFTDKIDGLILNTPMFAINTGLIPESVAFAYSKILVQLKKGSNFIPTTEPYIPEKHRDYKANPQLSRGDARSKFYHDVNVNIHVRPTRSGSIDWLSASFHTLHQILKPSRLKQVEIPVLLVRAEDDHVVRAEGIYTAGTYLPQVERLVILDGQHETFMDHDETLRPYVVRILSFIRKRVKEKTN